MAHTRCTYCTLLLQLFFSVPANNTYYSSSLYKYKVMIRHLSFLYYSLALFHFSFMFSPSPALLTLLLCLFPLQAVQEDVSIPGAFVKLNYLSTRAAGYLSLLRVLLTPPSPSSPVSPLGGLSKVHVRASVQGRLYQRWYPAGPGLVHRLVWNKTDVYGQEVWGLTYATGR